MTKARTRALGTLSLLAFSLLAQAQAQTTTPVQYIFAHGISNNCDTFFNTGTNPTICTSPAAGGLAAKIKTGGNASAPVYGQTIETKSIDINTQAQQFLSGMNNSGSSLPKVIIAHSQGVLRSRQAIQRLTGGANNVKGIISISGPNAGAPITVNAPSYARSVLADASTAGLLNVAGNFQGAWNLLVGLFTVASFNLLEAV